MEHKSFLAMQHICKKFGGVQALDDVTFCAEAGEIHALMGENGAGKSTLMKILSGVYRKDSGQIWIDGEEVKISDPAEGKRLGISIIHQEFALAGDLTVAENIYMDRFEKVINWPELNQKTKALLDELGFGNLNPRSLVRDISVAYQQVVEICKALSRNSRILVFDEPTALLTSNEVDKLFALIKALRERGVCIIYISHRLNEVFELCDQITVLKDGRTIGTVRTSDVTSSELVRMMIGRDLSEMYPPKTAKIGDVVFEAKHITVPHYVSDASFQVCSGEILGVSGLVGAGRTELMQGIFGARNRQDGQLYLNGQSISIKTPGQAVRCGIGMLPEDRKTEGVLLGLPISINGTLSSLKNYLGALGWINTKKEAADITEAAHNVHLKMAGIGQNVGNLSGGNQQKVALMKWVLAECSVLILDEPTRGVDVGAKIEIYRIMNELAANGVAIIMISSEMPEIIGMSDRVIVMREGRICGELGSGEISEYNLIRLSMGVN